MIMPEEGAEFQKPIDEQAKPEVHYGAQIEGLRTVLCCGRQVRRQRKIEGIAEQDCNQIFYQFGARKSHECNPCR